MQLIEQLFGAAIPMFANVVIFLYIWQRVRRARDNVRYIGEQVAKGMDEMKEDVGKELRVTDRLTNQGAKLAAVLQRFTALEENVIELVRTDRNRESVRIETPTDVTEEIKRILATAEKKKREDEGEWEEGGDESGGEWRNAEESKPRATAGNRTEVGTIGAGCRNPLSKFSACNPRESGFFARRTTATTATIDGRPRISTMPEVRLLGERSK